MVRISAVRISRLRVHLEAAPNSFTGSGPLGISGRLRNPARQFERAATWYHVASQKPLRAVRRLIKAMGSILAVTVHDRRLGWESRPTPAGATVPHRIVPVSAWLGVRAASSGRWFHAFACVDRSPGPRRGGQSKANGVGSLTQWTKGIDRDPCPTP